MDKIERFVVLMYSKTTELEKVNEARQLLFSKGRRFVESIPSTQAALLQHIYRSIYQSGYIWGQALVSQQQILGLGRN